MLLFGLLPVASSACILQQFRPTDEGIAQATVPSTPPTSISNLKCHAIMPVGQSNGDNSLHEVLSSKMCQIDNQVQLPHCLKRLVCQGRCIKNNKNFPRELFSRSQIYINSERPVLLDLRKSECWLLLVMFN